jgi:hypothetical protein
MSNTSGNESNRSGYHGDDDIIERNIEQSREVIEARQRHDSDDQLDQIDVTDPGNTRDFAPPGQSNVPIGGTSGPNERGGTAKRQKRG